jgi:hypothetical protein
MTSRSGAALKAQLSPQNKNVLWGEKSVTSEIPKVRLGNSSPDLEP